MGNTNFSKQEFFQDFNCDKSSIKKWKWKKFEQELDLIGTPWEKSFSEKN